MNELLLQSGLEKSIIIILLLLPVVATLIGIARHLLGLRSLGIYLSLIITFIFFKIGYIDNTSYSDWATGLKYGLPLVAIIFIATLICYLIFKRLAIHYYPKLSLVITGVTVILVLSIMLFSALNFKNILKIDAFTLILVVGISEKYFSTLTRKDLKTTFFVSFESILIAALCYLLISWNLFQDTLLAYPYLILALLPINYIVGKFTGLRLSEYLRFWGMLTDQD